MTAQEIIADPEFGRLKDYILGQTGLAYFADKDADLALRIAHRIQAQKARTCGAYLAILRDPQRGLIETDALVAELTIGETYFFRQREHFDALRQTVFPDIMGRNRASRRIEIWSAGCATGAEAYSVALLLQLEMADSIGGWDISILGTDINRGFLERARAGRFDDWTLRASSDELKARCFRREHKYWFLRPEFTRWTSFEYHNLAKDPFPVPPGGFDVILCRNVLIYFSQDRIRATVERLFDALAPGGWLLVGHAEHNAEIFRAFQTVSTAGAIVYQKPSEAGPQPECPAPVLKLPAHPVAGHPPVPFPLAAPVLPPPPPPPPELPDRSTDLEDVRALADRGQWEAAIARCRELLDTDGLNAAAHFTYGLILEHTGQPEEAEQYLRRAIYLDRSFVLAHYHLGLCLQRKRAVARARRSFENTVRLLALRPDQEKLKHGDGITVAELRESANMHLELLEAK